MNLPSAAVSLQVVIGLQAQRNGGSETQSRRFIGVLIDCCTTAFFLLPSSGRLAGLFDCFQSFEIMVETPISDLLTISRQRPLRKLAKAIFRIELPITLCVGNQRKVFPTVLPDIRD